MRTASTSPVVVSSLRFPEGVPDVTEPFVVEAVTRPNGPVMWTPPLTLSTPPRLTPSAWMS
jgi:hypothetical protein